MNGPRKLVLLAASIFAFAPLMFSSTYYISDAGGSVNCGGDGTQATQAYSFSGYSAGDTLKLCGTITHDLTVQQNGISIIFESNASLRIPACGNGCIQLNGHTGGLIDGGTPCGPNTSCSTNFGDYGLGSTATGFILQTTVGTPPATISEITCSAGVATVSGPSAFGYSLPNEPQVTISGNSVSSYNGTWTVASNDDSSNQFTFNASCNGTGSGGQVGVLCPTGKYCSVGASGSTNMIDGQSSGGSGWEIRNLAIGPYYLRTSYQDNGGGSEWESIYERGCNGCSSKIHDNTMANAGIVYVPASSGDNGLQIYNNALLGGSDSMVIAGSSSSNNLSGAQIHDNYIADNGIGDAPGCPAHLDGIHIWGLNGATESNVNFYNNWFTGNFGGCQTGAVYFEGNNVNDNIYNNLITTTYKQANNGSMSINGPGPFLVANNTILGQNDGDTCFEAEGNNWSNSGGSFSFQNNVISGCSTLVVLKDSPTLTAWDYNAFSLGGFNLNGKGYNWSGNAWKQACACDNSSQWFSSASSLMLNSNGSVQTGSPAIGAATSLATLGINPLNMDTSAGDTVTPVTRLSAPWTIGAYNGSGGSGGSPPAPPTGLAALVQ